MSSGVTVMLGGSMPTKMPGSSKVEQWLATVRSGTPGGLFRTASMKAL